MDSTLTRPINSGQADHYASMVVLYQPLLNDVSTVTESRLISCGRAVSTLPYNYVARLQLFQ